MRAETGAPQVRVKTRTLLRTDISRRGVLRVGASGTCAAAAGCANLVAGGARFDASDLSANPTLLVATTRKPTSGAREKPWFGPERGTMSVARVRLTPPDDGRFSLAFKSRVRELTRRTRGASLAQIDFQ